MIQFSYITCLGLMSGTSLDGLDLCYVRFNAHDFADFSIVKASTVSYPPELSDSLSRSVFLSGAELSLLDIELASFMARTVNEFLVHNNLDKPDLIASHGHTVFHQPEKSLSLQIGNGHVIAADTGVKTVCDFRMKDVALGGQGAPLVPVGDRLLFGDYSQCLNIGGIANISYQKGGVRVAYDICPANMVLNHLSFLHSKQTYDDKGTIARSGYVVPDLLSVLNSLAYYSSPIPKSLGKEWVDAVFMPCLFEHEYPLADVMRTVAEHIALQVSICANDGPEGDLLITGGGAKNEFLIELIAHKTANTVVVPDDLIVDYKEALIFALLGVLRLSDTVNCLSSVTGAIRDSSGGVVFAP